MKSSTLLREVVTGFSQQGIVGDLTLHEKIIAALEEVEHEIHEELESGHHGENGHDGHANGGHANGGHANGHGHGG